MLTVPVENEGLPTRHESKRSLSNSQALAQQQQQQQPFEPVFGRDVPDIKFRDVVLAKKFGSSPYDSDR
jgi:hypothetical protein